MFYTGLKPVQEWSVSFCYNTAHHRPVEHTRDLTEAENAVTGLAVGMQRTRRVAAVVKLSFNGLY